MNISELKAQIDSAALSDRAALTKLYMLMSVADKIKPEYEAALERSSNYQEFLSEVYDYEALKDTLEWAEIARLKRRNWLGRFEHKMLIQNLRLKTDGLPIQMESGVVLAPTGSRDNVCNFYLFTRDGFNQKAADFVTSLGGRFKIADYEFFGIYGLYKYRGNVILEEWEPEQEPVYRP